jgi:uncharacterized Ntn-hydrolase superfamily protein
MTWSIVARDEATGSLGVAVTTGAFGVGARCPWLRAHVGAVSTQSVTNHFLGPAILDQLAKGADISRAVADAVGTDPGRGIRQVHGIDRAGRTAGYSGENCVAWFGHRSGSNVSVAGNMLAGPQVLEATLDSYGSSSLPFADRLVTSLIAGDAVGGDRRGVRSATLKVIGDNIIPDIDLRVDYHDDPLSELGRLLALWRQQIEPRLGAMPSPSNPAGLLDLDELEAGWKQNGLDLRFTRVGAERGV